MILNAYVHKDDFIDTFEDAITFFKSIGYIDLNNDALWKWSSILYALYNIGIKETDTVVDIGGGRSPLTKILSNKCHIINVDNAGRNGNWFPLNDRDEYIKSTGIKSITENITYADMDFFDWCKTREDNSVDFFLDSCSVIHFNICTGKSKNDGCHRVRQEVTRILKSGGHFVVASDLLHPIHKSQMGLEYNKGEFLYFENLINLYNHGDLHIYGDVDFSFEEDFDTNILQIDPSLLNYNKLNHMYYPDKEDWQTFCHFEGSCGYNLALGRFTFVKDNI